ncbi:SDR family oxidoreductase [Shumkonia mesophila]|uniref:SDR family oxidoreductase n=1 Tax=Shumkonia mesophila TaxID=2838854 RepID=UPI002934EBC0|nr:SDR family oxidoreductase [Shumkonia mesophila]
MDVRLDGHVALVTGASLGIGRAIATQFAASGAAVALVARRTDVLETTRAAIAAETGGQVFAVPADVADAADCARAFAAASAALGPVDILVNNAGTSRRKAFEEITDALWQADLDLKLFGAIRLIRLAIPAMRAQRWGRILNILNIGAKAPAAGAAPTAVSRAAGLALTKVLAGELAPDNILVNALLVGRIQSDQWRQRAAAEGKDLAAFYAEMGKPIPLKRVGRAEEFAALACFLASDAGGYVTGTAINVDGGASPVV